MPRLRFPHKLVFGGLAVAWLGCADPSGTTSPPPAVLSVVRADDAHGLSARLVVELEQPAAAEVEYWTGAEPRLRVRSSPAQSHRVLLARLIPNAIYDYEVRSVGGDGRRSDPVSGTFTADSLPLDLRLLRFSARGQPTVPLVMLAMRTDSSLWWFAAVNGDGQIVWFWQSESPPQASTRLADGTFVLQSGSPGGLTAVRPDGEVVGRLPQPADDERIHHDVVATNNGTVFFLARAGRTFSDTTWMGEEVWEWDPVSGAEHRVWSSFDVLSPLVDRGSRSRPNDWLHANSLTIGPRGNLVVSFHFLDQVISIAPGYQSLEWRLGGTGSSITLPPEAVFSGQHTAAEVRTDHVLMFDNGFARPNGGAYSRALELELNRTAGAAQVAWEFRPRPDNYSRFISSAIRLANGNTLVGFGASAGALGSTGPTEVYEVTAGGRVIWHLLIEGLASFYRATPLSNITGEIAVPDP